MPILEYLEYNNFKRPLNLHQMTATETSSYVTGQALEMCVTAQEGVRCSLKPVSINPWGEQWVKQVVLWHMCCVAKSSWVPSAGFLSALTWESITKHLPGEGLWMPGPALLWQLLHLPNTSLVYIWNLKYFWFGSGENHDTHSYVPSSAPSHFGSGGKTGFK